MAKNECCYAVKFQSLKIGEEFASAKPDGITRSERKKEYKYIKRSSTTALTFSTGEVIYFSDCNFPCLIFRSRFKELNLKISDRANMIEYNCGGIVLNKKRLKDINEELEKCSRITTKIKEPTCCYLVNFKDVKLGDEFVTRTGAGGRSIKWLKYHNKYAYQLGNPKNILLYNFDSPVYIYDTRIEELNIIPINKVSYKDCEMIINGIKIQGWKSYPIRKENNILNEKGIIFNSIDEIIGNLEKLKMSVAILN